MTDTTYAEPTRLNDFKPNPFRDIPPAPNTNNSSLTTRTPSPPVISNRSTPHNLPERQNSLRNDGQWRTVQLYPEKTGGYAQRSQRYNAQAWTIKNNGTAGLTAGQSYARDEAFAQLAYHAGFFVDGFWLGVQGQKATPNEALRLQRTGAEDISYHGGNLAGRQLRKILEDASEAISKTREDLWRNRPHFEIPQIKIPEWDIKFPDFKIPAFDLPELPKPQPKPIPQPKPAPPPPKLTLRERLKDIDVSPCGRVYMVVAYASRVTEYRNIFDDEGRIIGGEKVFVQTSLSSVTSLIRKYNPYFSDKSDYEIAASHTGYGGNQVIESSEGYFNTGLWGYMDVNEDGFPRNPPFGQLRYPHQGAVMFYGEAINAISLNPLVEFFDKSSLIPELIYLDVDNPDTCPLTKDPPPPPPPPPEKDCCRMSCCPKPTEIDYRKIKKLMEQTLKEQSFKVDVPIISCEFNEQKKLWEPKSNQSTLEFLATSKEQAEQMAIIHIENAKQAAELCLARNNEFECYASVPDYWQTRSFQRSQLAIQYAENLGNGKLGRSRWCLHIPHYRYGESHAPSFPSYQKGNFLGVQVLSDNSKIIVWAASETECSRVINALRAYVDPAVLQNIESPQVTKTKRNIKKVSVVPVVCQFFPMGQKDTVPQWSKKLRKSSKK